MQTTVPAPHPAPANAARARHALPAWWWAGNRVLARIPSD